MSRTYRAACVLAVVALYALGARLDEAASPLSDALAPGEPVRGCVATR
jgi:hypothetical protein